MKSRLFSTKWLRLHSLRSKTLFWSTLLFLASWNYYKDFFAVFPSLLLGILITLEVIGMLFIGYLYLSKYSKFPRLKFWGLTFLFSALRYFIVFTILQHKLPVWTVFHHPGRSVPFLIFTSAIFLFLGYSYAIYEWGLAAREKYGSEKKGATNVFNHPIIIRSSGKTVRLLAQDVLFLEANGEYVNYITKNGNYMCFQRLKTAESELGNHGFIRVHRSFIVNPMYIASYSNTGITLKNDTEIPVSKTYKGHINAVMENSG